MATNPKSPDEAADVSKLSAQAQANVIQFISGVMMQNKQHTGFQAKMDAIDVAYARYKEASVNSNGFVDGKDVRGNVPCGNVFDDDDVTPPIVVSQVDAYVAYFAEVFLSGVPMFPVVSSPRNKKQAEQLETLLDDHAQLGAYPLQLLQFITDGTKYNFSGLECSWESIDQFSIAADFSMKGQKVTKGATYFNELKRLDPRNILRDLSVDPIDASTEGDFIGYVERFSKMRMKKLVNKLIKERKAYNGDKIVVRNNGEPGTALSGNYRARPIVNSYINAETVGNNATDWNSWFGDDKDGTSRVSSYGTKYELCTIYVRLMPSDFGIQAPQKNTPQIWKFRIVNNSMVLSAERVISAYDVLPILIGAPMQDGMGMQTKAIGESGMPFQKAASTLYNIRFAAARRAVSDRALYRSDVISSNDANARGPAPKIPVKMSILTNKTLDDVYRAIPFESKGLETVMTDAETITRFGDTLLGINKPMKGEFQKGNKSVQEWNDTTAGGDSRMRLRALVYEYAVFVPLRSMMTLNIYMNGQDCAVASQKTGEVINVNLDELRKSVLSFRLGDGYTPKSKLASVEAIAGGLQLLATSPILQQAYGTSLPGMFAHLMALQGVKGLEEYNPANLQQPTAQIPGMPVAQVPALAPPVDMMADPNAMPAVAGQGQSAPAVQPNAATTIP